MFKEGRPPLWRRLSVSDPTREQFGSVELVTTASDWQGVRTLGVDDYAQRAAIEPAFDED